MRKNEGIGFPNELIMIEMVSNETVNEGRALFILKMRRFQLRFPSIVGAKGLPPLSEKRGYLVWKYVFPYTGQTHYMGA